jgi:hypothetical protein
MMVAMMELRTYARWNQLFVCFNPVCQADQAVPHLLPAFTRQRRRDEDEQYTAR